MNFKEVNEISIPDFLERLGMTPCRKTGKELVYYSMIRGQERTTSFYVYTINNRWYDHGLGEGGKLFKLAGKLWGLANYKEVLKKFEDSHYSGARFVSNEQEIRSHKEESTLKLRAVEPLGTNKALEKYLLKRMISLEVAAKFCVEVYYGQKDKHFFGIGFPNDLGGYEVRSEYFKGCISSKWITTFKFNSNNCYVFEGFFDFLSWNELKKEIAFPDGDIIVLNSLANLSKAEVLLKKYENLFLFLDNDKSGEEAAKRIQEKYTNTVSCNSSYSEYKDLNDFLIHKSLPYVFRRK
jgi:hypothetical protein